MPFINVQDKPFLKVNRKKSIHHNPYTITHKGFTLIELLVVISIIAILITIIVATFGTTQQKARDSRRRTDLDALKKALELFKSDTRGASKYPSAISEAALVTPKYIKEIPNDPSLTTVNGGNYIYVPTTNDDRTCQGSESTSGNSDCEAYRLTACLENTNDASRDTTTNSICSTAGYASYTITNP